MANQGNDNTVYQYLDQVDYLYDKVEGYRTTENFQSLLNFCKDFPGLSPYNAMLVHTQLPGASFVLTIQRWKELYNRKIKIGATPLVILIPFGPVDFVFDISDTEPIDGHNVQVPLAISKSIEPSNDLDKINLSEFYYNISLLGISIEESKMGSTQGGFLRYLGEDKYFQSCKLYFNTKYPTEKVDVPSYYRIQLNETRAKPLKFKTLIHELAHFFCAHLSAPFSDWWTCRQLEKNQEEFEAETVAWLVCNRLNLGGEEFSINYLNGYLDEKTKTIPRISLSAVLKATHEIENLFSKISLSKCLLYKKDKEFKHKILSIKNKLSPPEQGKLDFK